MAPRFKPKHVPRRKGDDILLTPGRTLTQTIKRDGKRIVLKQKMLSDGSVKTTVDDAHTLEADLQAEQVSRLKELPDYRKAFLLAGDQNAARRGPVASLEAKRTGMEAGEPDLRIYCSDGAGIPCTLLIENKNGGGYLSKEQKERHEDFEAIGFRVYVIKTDDKERAAKAAIALLRYTQGHRRELGRDEFPEVSRHVEKEWSDTKEAYSRGG